MAGYKDGKTRADIEDIIQSEILAGKWFYMSKRIELSSAGIIYMEFLTPGDKQVLMGGWPFSFSAEAHIDLYVDAGSDGAIAETITPLNRDHNKLTTHLPSVIVHRLSSPPTNYGTLVHEDGIKSGEGRAMRFGGEVSLANIIPFKKGSRYLRVIDCKDAGLLTISAMWMEQ